MQDMDRAPVLVSVKCLAYNHENYIRDCLNGFIMQRTSFRFEVVVHDDASTDNTAVIIKEYAEKYPDLIVPLFETENQYSKHDGSLNRVVNPYLKGKYIAMCEGDDFWTDPDKLQRQVDILEHDETLMAVVTNSSIVDMRGTIIQEKQTGVVKDNVEGRYDLRSFFHDAHKYPTATVCFRNTERGRLDEMLKKTANSFFGDWNLWISLHILGDFYYLDQVTSAYRINPSSVVHSGKDERRLGLAKANFTIISQIQSILPDEYDDIKHELDKTAWMWFNLSNAYRHTHNYLLMIYTSVRCFLSDPFFLFEAMCVR